MPNGPIGEEDDLVHLLRAAVKRAGGQAAFARRYKVDRSRVNRILSRQLRSSEDTTLTLQRGYYLKQVRQLGDLADRLMLFVALIGRGRLWR